jgi:hypothetical protein
MVNKSGSLEKQLRDIIDAARPIGTQLLEAYERHDTWVAADLCVRMMDISDRYDDETARDRREIDKQLGPLSIKDALALPDRMSAMINAEVAKNPQEAFARIQDVRCAMSEMDGAQSGQLWINGVENRIEHEYRLGSWSTAPQLGHFSHAQDMEIDGPDRDGPDFG